MDSMENRRNAIVELINKNGTVNFAQIKKAFPSVSEMTLRTDLKALDTAKRIVRIHGGAKSVQVVIGTDDFLNKRSAQNIQAKQRIAKKALKLLKPNTNIFLDSGSTATEFARIFPDQPNLIYTSGLTCATELARLEKPSVALPGGNLNRYSLSVYGQSAIRELERVNFAQTYLGVTCFSYDTGFTCGNNDEAFLKQTAIQQSKQTIVLMDSSKIGTLSSFNICNLKDIDVIVSDDLLPEEFISACRKYNVTVL